MKIYRLLLGFLLLGGISLGQTHTFPALDTNNSFTGSNTFSQWNGFFYVQSPYSGCPAAVTAAGTTNGTAVFVPGTGPLIDCPPTFAENILVENFDKTREVCNGVVGGATPPCFALNYFRDDTNVFSGLRYEMTTNHLDNNGATLALYHIVIPKNVTANGTGGFDAISSEVNPVGTNSGAIGFASPGEFDSTFNATGGSYTLVRDIQGYTNVKNTDTTTIGTVEGVWGGGCNIISAAVVTNCYGVYGKDQLGQGSGRNYSVVSEGLSLFMWSGNQGKGGFDCEDKAHATHNCFFVDNSTLGTLNIQAVSTDGINLNASSGALIASLALNTFKFGVNPTPTVAGAVALGTSALPWNPLVLGTAAANAFTFTAAATSAARAVSIPDPGTNVNLGLVLTATSAGLATATTAGTCVQNTTAVTGAATSMAVSVSPVSTPGVGAQWSGFVSSAGNVTINECAVAASAGGTIAFNIRVIA